MSSYLDTTLQPNSRRETLAKLTKMVRNFMKTHSVNTVVGSGISGIGMGTLLAHQLMMNFAITRKGKERQGSGCHGAPLECHGHIGRYIIVDDGVHSGDTIKRIMRDIRKAYSEDHHKDTPKPKCIGVFLYAQHAVGRADRVGDVSENFPNIPFFVVKSEGCHELHYLNGERADLL